MITRSVKTLLEDVYKDREVVKRARYMIAASEDHLRVDRDTIAKARRRIVESIKRLQR